MRKLAILVAVGLTLWAQPVSAAPQNLFEWVAVAPIVVVAETVGQDGGHFQFRVQEVLRGDLADVDVFRVNIGKANRFRDRELLKPLRITPGSNYLLLLTPALLKKPPKTPTFELARGVRGAQELPFEGAEVTLRAVRRFIYIHELGDDRLTWKQFGEMLEETDALQLQVALEQFIKFQRGDVERLASVRPLLDHPIPELRELAARLIDQILTRNRWKESPVPDRDTLIQELVATARRDGSVSVRVAATEALLSLDGDGIEEVVEQIADGDPDQRVRYAAERLLYERAQRQQDREARKAQAGGT